MMSELPGFINLLEQQAQRIDKKVTVLFRETTASHWNSTNGYWVDSERKNVESNIKNNGGSCFCLRNISLASEGDYRNRFALETLHASNKKMAANTMKKIPQISVIPMFEYSANLCHFHRPFVSDCVHYTYTPFIFWPMFKAIGEAILPESTTTKAILPLSERPLKTLQTVQMALKRFSSS